MKVLLGVLVLIAAQVVGCAHTPEHGTVTMRISDQEAHVALSPSEVKPGDQVVFLKDTCGSSKVGPNAPCHNTKVADGVVTKNLNEKYAAVQIKPGGTYDEGVRVAKATQ